MFQCECGSSSASIERGVWQLKVVCDAMVDTFVSYQTAGKKPTNTISPEENVNTAWQCNPARCLLYISSFCGVLDWALFLYCTLPILTSVSKQQIDTSTVFTAIYFHSFPLEICYVMNSVICSLQQRRFVTFHYWIQATLIVPPHQSTVRSQRNKMFQPVLLRTELKSEPLFVPSLSWKSMIIWMIGAAGKSIQMIPKRWFWSTLAPR